MKLVITLLLQLAGKVGKHLIESWRFFEMRRMAGFREAHTT